LMFWSKKAKVHLANKKQREKYLRSDKKKEHCR